MYEFDILTVNVGYDCVRMCHFMNAISYTSGLAASDRTKSVNSVFFRDWFIRWKIALRKMHKATNEIL